jgi:hypothetical protein
VGGFVVAVSPKWQRITLYPPAKVPPSVTDHLGIVFYDIAYREGEGGYANIDSD